MYIYMEELLIIERYNNMLIGFCFGIISYDA